MIFSLEVPKLARWLSLILLQNNWLIESNWLVRILYMRLHKLCCWERRQTLFKLKRNFPRIFIKGWLVVSIIDRKAAERAELVSSQTFRLSYFSTILYRLSCFLIFDAFSSSKTYLIIDHLTVLLLHLFHLFFNYIRTLKVTPRLSTINLWVIVRCLFSCAHL